MIGILSKGLSEIRFFATLRKKMPNVNFFSKIESAIIDCSI